MAETAVDKPKHPLLTKADLPAIVSRYLAGESMQAIAQDSTAHVRTLYRWMLGGLGDRDYHALVTDCLISRVADADDLLRTGADPCQIARAREMARFARMDLERRRPHLYGPKQEVKSEQTITIQVQRYLPPPEETQVIELTPQPVDITPNESA